MSDKKEEKGKNSVPTKGARKEMKHSERVEKVPEEGQRPKVLQDMPTLLDDYGSRITTRQNILNC